MHWLVSSSHLEFNCFVICGIKFVLHAWIVIRYGDLIGRVPFFASLHDRAKVELCKKIKSFTLMPGDMIMTKGAVGLFAYKAL